MCRIDGEDLPDDEPVEEHADGSQMLLDCRLRGRCLQGLDIGGNVQRLDIGELADPMPLNPGEEVAHGPVIGYAGVLVADLGCKEFEEAPRRVVAGVGDRRRYRERAARSRRFGRHRIIVSHRRQVTPLGAHRDTLQVNWNAHIPTSPQITISVT